MPCPADGCRCRVLERHRATAQQVGLTRAARRSNLRGAFREREAEKAGLAGRHILLVMMFRPPAQRWKHAPARCYAPVRRRLMSSLWRGLLCPKLWLYDGLMTHLSVACVQLCSGCDPGTIWPRSTGVSDWRPRRRAPRRSAGSMYFYGKNRAAMRARLFTEQKSPQVAAFAELARAGCVGAGRVAISGR